MGTLELFILVGSVALGGFLYGCGTFLRDDAYHDGLGFFFQIIGSIFAIIPFVFIFCCICIAVVLGLGLVAKAIFSILI